MQRIKFVQVNIFKGKYLDSLVDFLRKEDPDFVTMQEVSSGEANYWEDKTVNTFDFLKSQLGMQGVFYNMVDFSDAPEAAVGNAVLSRYSIRNSKNIVLHKHKPILLATYEDRNYFPYFTRMMVDTTVDIGESQIHVLSMHGAWTAPPTDTPETLRQARVIADYLSKLNEPFILGADMNTTPDKQVIKTIENVAVNMIAGSNVLFTTHPTMHKIAPLKLLVDYIFVSKEFKRLSIEASEVLVSDHLPVVAELAIGD